MAYSTATAATPTALVNDLATFIEANGWTRDSLIAEASGRRYHAHRSGQYLNMRGYINEQPSSSLLHENGSSTAPPTGVYSVAMNLSTAYSGATTWFNQTGVLTRTGAYHAVGATDLSASMTYHFFAQNSGDQIFVVIEYASGKYQWFGFGIMTKSGTWTGGDFMFGSNRGTGTIASNASRIGGPYKFYNIGNTLTPFSDNPGPPSFVKVDVDAETGWHEALSADNFAPTKRRVVDMNVGLQTVMSSGSPNSVNSVSVFAPVKICVSRTAAGGMSAGTSVNYAPLGEIPGFFTCWIENFVPGQQVTFGSEDYRVFPWCGKGTSATNFNTSTRLSGYFGFAIKE